MAGQAPLDQEVSWIQDSKNGSQTAFQKLYDANVSSLYRFLKQFSRSDHEVEDWVQRAFIKAFKAIHQFEGKSRFGSWLFRIALNEMRTDRRRMNVVTSFDSSEENQFKPSAEPDTFEWDETMKAFLDRLDETRKAVFILYEVEGYSHAEIAAMHGFGESTSRTILSRTKQWLRKQWENEQREI